MGLSNSERINKVTWAANRIHEISKELDSNSSDFECYSTRILVENLKNECQLIIPKLFSKNSNSRFWLLGSDTKISSENTTLFSIAIHDNIKYANTPEADLDIENLKPRKEGFSKSVKELFEYSGYLSNQGKKVYSIYEWCQQFLYASNRYSDDLSKKYLDVNYQISLILNECFNIFRNEKQFAVAYLKFKIFPDLISASEYSKREDWDPLTKYIIENHIYFQFKKIEDHDQYAIDHLKIIALQLQKKNTIRERFFIWLKYIVPSINSEKDTLKLKELCKKIKVSYAKHVQVKVNTNISLFKKGEIEKREEYQNDAKEDFNQLLHREVDPFYFMINGE